MSEKKEPELIENNLQQVFSDEGMMEQTNNRSNKIIDEIKNVLAKEKLNPVINRGFGSECKTTEDGNSLLFFTGEDVIVRFKVPATDKFGNDGRKWLTKKDYDNLTNKINEQNKK